MSWAVLQTQPNREVTAVEHATRAGFECWLPRTRQGPLFSRYAFVVITEFWQRLLSTKGVSDVLRSGSHPAVVPNSQMEALRGMERGGLIVLPPRLNVGDDVRVRRGTFANEVGLYDGMSRQGRVHVLLSMLGRSVRIELDENNVCPV